MSTPAPVPSPAPSADPAETLAALERARHDPRLDAATRALLDQAHAALATAHDEAAWRGAVERAIADADSVLEIFTALLRIAEIEGGDRRAGFARFDLAAALRDVAEVFGPEAEASGHALVLDMPPALEIEGDRTLLQQATANLLGNALRHTPPGTQVTLRLDPGPPAAITVADTGPGVAEPDRARLGTPFLRLEESRGSPGHGLGLALARAVAELHGGRLVLGDAAPGLIARLDLAPLRSQP